MQYVSRYQSVMSKSSSTDLKSILGLGGHSMASVMSVQGTKV